MQSFAVTLTMALGRRGMVPGLIHHSDHGSQGGFNRSSQHPVSGGVYDNRQTKTRTFDTGQIMLARTATGLAT